jgi:hypothetical protein
MPFETNGIGGIMQPTEAFEAINNIPQNRVLMAGKFTANTPLKPTIAQDITTIEQVFRHFAPAMEIEFETEDGTIRKENISFKELSDFGVKGITHQSGLLNELTMKKEQYQKIIRQLKSNIYLRQALSDKTSKQNFISALQALIEELNEANNSNSIS